MSTSIKLDISEGQIRDAIAIGIAEAFSPERRDALLRDIIRAHLQYRENSYDKETLLGKRIGGLVREIASQAAKERVEELRPQICAIVREHLGERFEETLFAQLRERLGAAVVSNVRLAVDLDEA